MADDKSDPNRQALLQAEDGNETAAEEKPSDSEHAVPNGRAEGAVAGSDLSKHERSKSPEKLLTPNGSVTGSDVTSNQNGSIPKTVGLSNSTSLSSLARRRIIMEQVAPSTSSIIEGDRDWRMSLDIFTNSRQGKENKDKSLPRRIRRYYKAQDELITAFEEIHLGVDDAMEAAEDYQKSTRMATLLAKVSFFANLALLIGKAIAAGLSGSLAIISSVIDSVVDLVSGALMWWSGRAIKDRDPYHYPQGRTKLEPIAIVILSVVMALASVQIIRESVEKIIYYATNESHGPNVDVTSIVICTLTIGLKLVLFIVCRRVKHPATQVLAQDHRNDILSNTVALACGILGDRVWKFADPIGAILISIYIIINWSLTGWEQIKMLTGHTANPDFLKKITWIALNHHKKVLLIDTVRAFHFGNNFLVEVDIVLPEGMTLRESHDIGETLQLKIEQLPEVERAFVHLDYECEHHPNSEHKVV